MGKYVKRKQEKAKKRNPRKLFYFNSSEAKLTENGFKRGPKGYLDRT